MRVRKAVFPAAGWGTRFLPATKAQPKEMLPLVDKPIIQYAVEEAVAAGIEQVIIVTSSQKRAIEDHFDLSYELEHLLEEKGDIEMLRQVRAISDLAQVAYVRQKEQLGLGHAVLMAKDLIGHEPFAVILPDDVVVGDRPCIGQLIHAYHQTHGSVVAVMEVPPEETGRYGDHRLGADRRPARPRPPAPRSPSSSRSRPPATAPSNLAIIGRYVLTPKIFDKLEQTQRGAGGEIQLTDAIAALMEEQQVFGYEFEGTRYDAGTTMGWLKASVEIALTRARPGHRVPRLPARASSSDRPARGVRCRAHAQVGPDARGRARGRLGGDRAGPRAAAIDWSSCSAAAGWRPSIAPPTPDSVATSRSSSSDPEYLRDPDFSSRFRQEAQAAASLSHPNIVTRLRLRRGPERPVHRHGADRRRGPRHDPPAERRRCRRARSPGSVPASPGRSRPPTPAASSIATSSRATC